MKTLAKMHEKGYLHLDLKLENIMLSHGIDSENINKNTDIKLIDFGFVEKMEKNDKGVYIFNCIYGVYWYNFSYVYNLFFKINR